MCYSKFHKDLNIQMLSLIMDALQNNQTPQSVFKKIGINPPNLNDSKLWSYLFMLAQEERFKSNFIVKKYINQIKNVVDLLQNAKNIVVVIGAGASVGPDFRSPGGLYDTISKSGSLEDPYQVFDLDYFKKDPSIFWRYAHMIFPETTPKHSHAQYFFAELEKKKKLLRLYSQNVDTLEIGIPDEKLRCVHGSWRENKCLNCGEIHTIEDLRENVENQTIPVCKKCGGQIKPGIVFFGQKTNLEDSDVINDSKNADLLIVVGTSLRVAPVSFIPDAFFNVPSILINREPVTCHFNAELLGDCDSVIRILEDALEWNSNPEGKNINDFEFIQPNKFLLRSHYNENTSFYETGRSIFQVSPTKI